MKTEASSLLWQTLNGCTQPLASVFTVVHTFFVPSFQGHEYIACNQVTKMFIILTYFPMQLRLVIKIIFYFSFMNVNCNLIYPLIRCFVSCFVSKIVQISRFKILLKQNFPRCSHKRVFRSSKHKSMLYKSRWVRNDVTRWYHFVPKNFLIICFAIFANVIML